MIIYGKHLEPSLWIIHVLTGFTKFCDIIEQGSKQTRKGHSASAFLCVYTYLPVFLLQSSCFEDLKEVHLIKPPFSLMRGCPFFSPANSVYSREAVDSHSVFLISSHAMLPDISVEKSREPGLLHNHSFQGISLYFPNDLTDWSSLGLCGRWLRVEEQS